MKISTLKGVNNMKKINLNKAKKIHFIGIGGISMSALAETLKRDGYDVTGSDDVKSSITDHLQKVGIPVEIPTSAENISDDIDLVVYSAAVRQDNPEHRAAIAKGKTLTERAALLGIILEGYENTICVAGTHGKTTATSLLAEIALDAKLDPTIFIGGHMARDGTNYRVGNSSYFVMEACEYSNQFHHWYPFVGVILNIDADHLDFFGDFNGVIKSFRRFAENIRPGGVLVIQNNTPGFDEVTKNLSCKVVTFGENEGRFTADNIVYDTFGRPAFDISDNGKFLARINLPLPGRYNMLNALAVFAAAYETGISPEVAANALSNAKGVKRRFEHKGMYNGAYVTDDYAHHPTEISECLSAARKAVAGKLICLFQPHTYTRTKNLLEEFAESLTAADKIIILPIFAAREPFDGTISSRHLEESIKRVGGDVIHINSFEEAVIFLQQILMPNDMLITMGAGDVYLVGEQLLST
jgi:UDP-N-acetylmuramate--alanine ligase